jgi:predicted Zn-dependent peptidase
MSGLLQGADPPRIHTLANGVRVVCDPVPGLQTVALVVAAGRGARWEGHRESGWSHLLEHMVFKGAAGRSARQLAEAIESGGGQMNAETGFERTVFHVRTLPDGLDGASGLLSDILLRPTLDPDDLRRERRVVLQEIAESEDAPDDLVFEMAQAAAFADQALGRCILGDAASLKRADVAALRDWRRALYAPDRLVVVASGAVDEDVLLRLAERDFAAAEPEPSPPPSPALFTGGVRTDDRSLEQANLVFLCPGLAATDPDAWAAQVFVECLGGGMASRLFQEAREARGLAYAVDAWGEFWSDCGMVGVFAGCEAASATELAVLAAGQMQDLAQAPREAELARARAQLKAGQFMAAESLLTRAEQAAHQVLTHGRPIPTSEIAARIDACDAAAVRRAGARLLERGLAAAAVLGPGAAHPAAERFCEAMRAGTSQSPAVT